MMLFKKLIQLELHEPCTKHNWLVKDTNILGKTIHEAFYVSTNGRPGPVLVDIPKDVQFATGSYLKKKILHLKDINQKQYQIVI